MLTTAALVVVVASMVGTFVVARLHRETGPVIVVMAPRASS
jgi:hypothetical protein